MTCFLPKERVLPCSKISLGALCGSTEHEVVRMTGGHIGLSTGGSAQRRLWPRVAAWLAAHEPVMQSHNAMMQAHKNVVRAHKKRKARR